MGLGFFLLPQDHPVILVVIFVSVFLEELLEHGLHGTVLRFFIESKVSALAEIFGKLSRVTFA